MNNLLSSVAFGALLLATGSAYAADPAGPIADRAAPSFFGNNIEVGGIVRNAAEYGEIDPDVFGLEDETTIAGAYGALSLWGNLDTIRLGLDGYVEGMVFDDVAEDNSLTPVTLAVLGAHAGLDLDSGYVGVFGAVGVYPNANNEYRQTGVAGGVEGIVAIDEAVALFGRVGYAFAPSDEYDPNNPDPDELSTEGFIGPFFDVGVTYALSDDLAVLGHVGAGYSDGFDYDKENPGGYVNWGAKLAYRLPTDFAVNLVASYDGYYAYTVEERDEVIEHTFKLGLSIPFGDGGTAAQTLNPLATSAAPFRAGYSSDQF